MQTAIATGLWPFQAIAQISVQLRGSTATKPVLVEGQQLDKAAFRSVFDQNFWSVGLLLGLLLMRQLERGTKAAGSQTPHGISNTLDGQPAGGAMSIVSMDLCCLVNGDPVRCMDACCLPCWEVGRL